MNGSSLSRLITLFILILILAGGCREAQDLEPSGKVVKLGLIAPLSGPAGGWGQSGLQGIETALALQPYLLNGDRVELVLADDQNIPALTKEALINLVKVERVAAVLMFSDSSAVLEAVELADTLETPLLVLLSTHPDVTRNRWVSQFVFDDITQGKVAALYIRDELLVDHVAVFKDVNDPHSTILADEFSSKFIDTGGSVSLVEIDAGDNDLNSVIKGLKAKQLKFLYLPLEANKVLTIERVARDMLWDVGVMVGDGLLSQILLQYKEESRVVDGMLATDLYSSDSSRTEYGRMVSKMFQKKFGKTATTFSALGLEGTSVLLAAMDKCGRSDNRSCINNKLRSDVEFSGIYGQIRSQENGKIERPIFINKIENTKLKSVVKVY
jgi:branched-chain amino acid transport system substrate-binding protein